MHRAEYIQFSAWTWGIDMGSWVREGAYLCACVLPESAGPRDLVARPVLMNAENTLWAEVAPLDGYGMDTMEHVCALLPAALDWLRKQAEDLPATPGDLPRSRSAFPDAPSLRWGVELLLAKLAAREAGQALGTWLGARPDVEVPVAGLVLRGDAPLSDASTVSSSDASTAPLSAAPPAGANGARNPHVVKLKIGRGEGEAARIRRLVAAQPGIRIRLDANRGGSPAGLLRLLESLGEDRRAIDFIEEPLPAGEPPPADLAAALEAEPPIALAADESLREAGWALGEAHWADVWVIKPSLHGGLTEVLDTLEAARVSRRRVVWSSAWESGVGMAGLKTIARLWPDEAAGFGTEPLMPHQMTMPTWPVASAHSVSAMCPVPAVCPVAFMASCYPRRTAMLIPGINDTHEAITYGDLHARVSAITTHLARQDFPARAAIAVPADRTATFLAVLFAVMRLGRHLLPVSSRLPDSARDELVASAGAVWVGNAAEHLPDTTEHSPDTAKHSPDTAGHAYKNTALAHAPFITGHMRAGGAVLVATSGSTGAPSIVTIDWARMLGHAAAVNERTDFTSSDAWAWSLPPWHVGGLSIPVRCAVAGGRVVVESGTSLATTHPSFVATHHSLVPTQLDRVLAPPGSAPTAASASSLFSRHAGALRCVLVGGGPVPLPLLERAVRAGIPVRTTWGMTEAGSMISCSDVWTEDDVRACDRVHAGRPLPGIRVRQVPPDQKASSSPKPPDQGPELPNQGPELPDQGPELPSQGSELLDQGPEAACSGAGMRLEVHSPWAARAHDALTTSDAGYLDDEGRVVVTGRLDRVFISGGENIDPAVIEQALVALPEVERARVVGIPHPEFGFRPVAFIQTGRAVHDARPERAADLRKRLRASLPGYMIPDAMYEEPALPEGRMKWTEAELVAWAGRNHRRGHP